MSKYPTITLPKFVSVEFYPAYDTGTKNACGRYVALGADGRVYVLLMEGESKWMLAGWQSYE